MIVLSPIPDPSDLKHRAGNFVSKVKGAFASMGGDGDNAGTYQSNFDKAPDVLGDDSDDNDEEDVGKDFSSKKDLNYDSDEKDEFGNSEQTELVVLEPKPKQEQPKKNIPKLKKPGSHA
jgi:hypothetical protein